MPTRAAIGILIPVPGKNISIKAPKIAPPAPPIVKSGASVPPEVPLPRAIAQERNLKKHKFSISASGIFPESILIMLL
ncbi:hypothetical protein D3C87_1624080 [compost metagenome]